MHRKLIMYKYPLDRKFCQEIQLPVGSQIKCIMNQNENPVLYALVPIADTDEYEFYNVFKYNTGEAILHNDKMQYLSTCMFNGGNYVAHYFISKINIDEK